MVAAVCSNAAGHSSGRVLAGAVTIAMKPFPCGDFYAANDCENTNDSVGLQRTAVGE